jgi:5-methyltetrahydrofolate--homocysteine methyltransferase
MIDRPLIQVTALKEPLEPGEAPADEQALLDWFSNPERVIPRLERKIKATHWGGEAFPLGFPVSPFLVAIEAAYLGCPYKLMPQLRNEVGGDGPLTGEVHYDGGGVAWSEPIIDDWDNLPSLGVDPHNFWWRTTQRLLELSAERGAGRYYVGIPDLQGGGHIAVMLRGAQRIALDLYDHPQQVKRFITAVNEIWLYYFEACFEILHLWLDGYVDWLGVWSQLPSVTVECDFAAMISPGMFIAFFLPALEQQVAWIERTIYHLDGPGQLVHLDTLLSLSKLDGIQWVPVKDKMSDWIPLLQRIQRGGKLLVLDCEPWEVKRLLTELKPEGLLLRTSCGSVEEAERLMEDVERMFRAV